MQGFLYRTLCGFLLGISIFAPGFSASMLTIIMGIYEKLIGIVANPVKDFKKNVIYLFPMGIGALISLVLFILSFEYLFRNFETATYLLFIGLIVGSLPELFKRAKETGLKAADLVGFLAAVILALGLAVYASGMHSQAGASGEINLIFLSVCGMIAGAVALIPGMSVSMMLMVLGVYHFLLQAAKSVDVTVILVVGAAFILGMVAFARVIKFVFSRFARLAGYVVLGFMIGSIMGLFYGLPVPEGFNFGVGAAMVALGIGLAVLFFIFGEKYRKMQ